MEDLVSKLNTIETDNSDIDDYYTADSEPEMRGDYEIDLVSVEKENCRGKPTKVKSRPQKENIDVTKRAVKSAVSKVRKTKKKDSFIVSDDSSITDDDADVTIYHRIISKNIKADVRKVTPKAASRKNVPTYDDPMFSAYIITKRSGSEYSSSDEYDDYDKSPTEVPPPLSLNLNLNNRTNETSDDDSKGGDVGSENDYNSNSTSQPKKKGYERSTSSSGSQTRSKKFSWISTDDSSSSSGETACKTNKKSMSFLKSLSNDENSYALHPDAEKYRKNFKKWKEELALRLFKMFNEEVFKNQLPSDLKIEWNARLTKCAGKCYNERNKSIIGPDKQCLRVSRIELSKKILESADRLRDTLIHEMCHAASWIIDKECNGHGPLWKSWATKAMNTFPELPMIERCHTYEISTKFKYRCVRCGYTIGRHSKSLKVDLQLCGYCNGVFVLVEQPASTKPTPKFASFVKENYSKIRSEKRDLNHKQIMKELSENFASAKISN